MQTSGVKGPDGGNSQCKGPGAGTHLECLSTSNSQETSVIEATGEWSERTEFQIFAPQLSS